MRSRPRGVAAWLATTLLSCAATLVLLAHPLSPTPAPELLQSLPR